ncbi:hypothetical protein ACFPOE_20525 [Caenimonas terrae]|uniref:Uncharacterized protein n=1 Tax=Caenimonas terrae TaxID=696074 RepID=A0ABW0NH03_9BURK
MTFIRSIWDAALGRPARPDFQPSQGNRRRVEIYDALIERAQARAEATGSVDDRLKALHLISRLDARCKREIRRREDQTRP